MNRGPQATEAGGGVRGLTRLLPLDVSTWGLGPPPCAEGRIHVLPVELAAQIDRDLRLAIAAGCPACMVARGKPNCKEETSRRQLPIYGLGQASKRY